MSVKKTVLLLLILLTALCAAPRAHASQEETGIVITKSPTGEKVNEGEDAMFVSRARGYTGIVWLFISPDGETVYENEAVLDAFPGLEMSGSEGEELSLISIPFTLNGWYVQTKFVDAYGGYALTDRAQIVVEQGEVPSPVVTQKSAGARMTVGETKTLTVEAKSPSGDPLKYQWYRSYSAARSSGEPILGATSAEYTPPEEIGQVFYYVGVWCVRGRQASAPIYTTPVAIVYSLPEATPEPTAVPSVTPEPTPPANTGGGNPLFSQSNALFFVIAAVALLTVLAVTATFMILKAVAKQEKDDDMDDDDADAPEGAEADS